MVAPVCCKLDSEQKSPEAWSAGHGEGFRWGSGWGGLVPGRPGITKKPRDLWGAGRWVVQVCCLSCPRPASNNDRKTQYCYQQGAGSQRPQPGQAGGAGLGSEGLVRERHALFLKGRPKAVNGNDDR